jgi:hypothetical protein
MSEKVSMAAANHGAAIGSDAAGVKLASSQLIDPQLQGGSQTVTLTGTGAYTLAAGQTISVTNGGGIVTTDGATLDIEGLVSGNPFGIDALAGLDLRNGGTIIGLGQYSPGQPGAVEVTGAAYVYNSGLIKSPSFGVKLDGRGTVINTGSIIGATAVKLSAGGTVTNTGDITGTYGSAIWLTDGGSATNSGTLISEKAGGGGIVIVGRSGDFTNEAGGLVKGVGVIAVGLKNGGTFTNAGTVASNTGVSVRLSGGNSTLVDVPGAVFTGAVVAFTNTGEVNTLDLAAGAPGSIGLISKTANYSGFSTLNVEAGATWKIGTASGSSISGITQINDLGTLTVSSIHAGTSINLEGSAAVLALAGAGTASFAGVISGIAPGGQIDLGGSFLPTPPAAADIDLSFNAATGVLSIRDTIGGSIHTDALTFTGHVQGSFSASLLNNEIVIADVPCFAAGTRLLAPTGEIAVEDVRIGDELLTLRGHEPAGRVIWTGRRGIDLARHPRPDKVIPVRIFAGALAAGLPERDLLLSPDHCLFIDGHLIEAKLLVNGATVIRDESIRHITYHHIELERHDVVLAEGVPAETFLDSGNRNMFEAATVPMLHPDFTPATRPEGCAPLAQGGFILHTVRQRLLDRAFSLGFTLTSQTDLTVKAGLETLQPLRRCPPDRLLFTLARPYATVDLLSSAGVPAHCGADPDDQRRLGAAVAGLRLLTEAGEIEIALDDEAHRGFHAAEATHRWTDGAARIALPAYSGGAVLEVRLLGQTSRWTDSRPTARHA